MRKLHLPVLLALLAVFSNGCATGSFDPGRPIESNNSVFRERAYAQDGKAINIRQMRGKLEDIPESRDSALSSDRWKTAGQLSAVAGFGLIISSLATSDSTQTWLLVGCIPTLLFEIVAFAVSDSRLQDAVNEFNGSLNSKTAKPVHASITPYFSLTQAGAPTGGLSLAF